MRIQALLAKDTFLPSLYNHLDPDNDGKLNITSLTQIPIVVANIIQILLAIIAVLAVIFIVYAGIQYIISQGDPGKTQSAKSTITNAVVGLLLSASAYILVDFFGEAVLMRFLKISVMITVLLPQAIMAADPPDPLKGCTGKNCVPAPDRLGLPQVSLESGAGTVFNILSLVAGILSVIFLVIGGIKYATSEGDSSKLTSAKNTLTYAILGLIISILAPLIASFVIGRGPQ